MRIVAPIILFKFLDVATGNRILIKDGRALEQFSLVDTVVFDKTGTLTSEVPTLREIHAVGSFSEATVLECAAAAEQHQSHPLALAILAEAKRRGINFPLLEHTEIEEWYAGVVPQGKAGLIRRLQSEGRKVCFVGDGLNDTIALKQAELSVSLQGATKISREHTEATA